MGLFNHRGLSQCSPQVDWITDALGHEFVDFVGRFEKLETDFGTICERLGIVTSVPHLNSSRRKDYLTYFDDDCVELIANGYAADFQRFGYSPDPLERGTNVRSAGDRDQAHRKIEDGFPVRDCAKDEEQVIEADALR